MFEIRDREKDTWVTCSRCGKHLRMSSGGSCRCGGVQIDKPDKNGVQAIIEDDDNLAVVEIDE